MYKWLALGILWALLAAGGFLTWQKISHAEPTPINSGWVALSAYTQAADLPVPRQADTSTLLVWHDQAIFLKDKSTVYAEICEGGVCSYKPVPGVDAATFDIVATKEKVTFAQDANNKYACVWDADQSCVLGWSGTDQWGNAYSYIQ